MQHLRIQPGTIIKVQNASLPKGTFVKLRPQTKAQGALPGEEAPGSRGGSAVLGITVRGGSGASSHVAASFPRRAHILLPHFSGIGADGCHFTTHANRANLYHNEDLFCFLQ